MKTVLQNILGVVLILASAPKLRVNESIICEAVIHVDRKITDIERFSEFYKFDQVELFQALRNYYAAKYKGIYKSFDSLRHIRRAFKDDDGDNNFMKRK
jgi:hypothetical protein